MLAPWPGQTSPSTPCAAGTHNAFGTAVGQQHLRSILAFCNSPLMFSVEAYIQFTPNLITDDGEVTDESTKEFLRNYMEEYRGFIQRVLTVLPQPGA